MFSCTLGAMADCAKCGTDVPNNELACPCCYTPAGFPNVKMAAAEAPALAQRLKAVQQRAQKRGVARQLEAFENAVAGAQSVISVDVGFLGTLLQSPKALYAAYQDQVDAGTRLRATPADDRNRTAVEGTLFGSWGRSISYAALSLDGRGLLSYGPLSIQLKEAAVEDRASVLEENSYHFVQRHRLVAGDPLPLGFRAPWRTRGHVASAKLGDKVKQSTQAKEYARLLLSSGTSRSDDDFVEVHLFGPFNRDAIAHISVLETPRNPPDQVLLDAVRPHATTVGITWTNP
jgi:hypothetical protein